MVDFLLEKGACLESSDRWEWTALTAAAYWGWEGVVRLLLEKGANCNLRDNEGKTPLAFIRYRLAAGDFQPGIFQFGESLINEKENLLSVGRLLERHGAIL